MTAAALTTDEARTDLETVTVMVTTNREDPTSHSGARLKLPREAKLLPLTKLHGQSTTHPSGRMSGTFPGRGGPAYHLLVDDDVLEQIPIGALMTVESKRFAAVNGDAVDVLEVLAHEQHQTRPLGEDEEVRRSCLLVQDALLDADVETGLYERARRASEAGRRHGEQLEREMNRRKRRQATEEALAALTPEERSEVLATLSDDELTS